MYYLLSLCEHDRLSGKWTVTRSNFMDTEWHRQIHNQTVRHKHSVKHTNRCTDFLDTQTNQQKISQTKQAHKQMYRQADLSTDTQAGSQTDPLTNKHTDIQTRWFIHRHTCKTADRSTNKAKNTQMYRHIALSTDTQVKPQTDLLTNKHTDVQIHWFIYWYTDKRLKLNTQIHGNAETLEDTHIGRHWDRYTDTSQLL